MSTTHVPPPHAMDYMSKLVLQDVKHELAMAAIADVDEALAKLRADAVLRVREQVDKLTEKWSVIAELNPMRHELNVVIRCTPEQP